MKSHGVGLRVRRQLGVFAMAGCSSIRALLTAKGAAHGAPRGGMVGLEVERQVYCTGTTGVELIDPVS